MKLKNLNINISFCGRHITIYPYNSDKIHQSYDFLYYGINSITIYQYKSDINIFGFFKYVRKVFHIIINKLQKLFLVHTIIIGYMYITYKFTLYKQYFKYKRLNCKQYGREHYANNKCVFIL